MTDRTAAAEFLRALSDAHARRIGKPYRPVPGAVLVAQSGQAKVYRRPEQERKR